MTLNELVKRVRPNCVAVNKKGGADGTESVREVTIDFDEVDGIMMYVDLYETGVE